jgi:hypothetical protein
MVGEAGVVIGALGGVVTGGVVTVGAKTGGKKIGRAAADEAICVDGSVCEAS